MGHRILHLAKSTGGSRDARALRARRDYKHPRKLLFLFFFCGGGGGGVVGGLKSFGLQYFNNVSSRAIMALGFVDPFCPRHL